jgi:hypothetical protein
VNTFEVVEVKETWSQFLEQMGTKKKFWYRHGGERWLFKYPRPGTGEHWAEKLAAYFCEKLEIPHARYELAIYRETSGVTSQSFLRTQEEQEDNSGFSVENKEQLILGNQLISLENREYAANRTIQKNSWHTIHNVFDCLKYIAPPKGWTLPGGIETARDVFLGYLMLDALIGNGDRHDENWAVVAPITGSQRSLAPTFDHASSLGRNVLNEERKKRMTTKDINYSVGAYAKKSRSALYLTPDEQQPLSTVDAFVSFGQRLPIALDRWLRLLDSLTPGDIKEGIRLVPSKFMSQEAGDFAEEVMVYNRDRLLQLRTTS